MTHVSWPSLYTWIEETASLEASAKNCNNKTQNVELGIHIVVDFNDLQTCDWTEQRWGGEIAAQFRL